MAPKDSSKGKWKAMANMPTSVINRRLSLDRDCLKGFISEHIHGLIRRYNVCGVMDEREWDHFYDIIFLDPVNDSPRFTIPANVAAPQEQEFAFSGVVGCLLLIYGANV